MKYAVKISKVAKEDLRDIYKYIAYDLLSPQTALNQLDRLEQKIYSLENMPTKYRVYDKEISTEIRFIPVNNYCVFYKINEENSIVDIIRVIYGGRNIENIL
ncbi:MAG: type II toxin-antitoxin system RelE/ParE family toxin [Clostridia bacterium]